MQIIPVKELKDGAHVSEMCHATDEPIYVTKNGYSDMVIMSAEAYDAMSERVRRSEAIAMVVEGVAAVQRGEVRNAFEAASEIRAKYGL
ncbi:type II toxin-antitoxin system Phd/YefM family antitoxin [Atopobium sp. oral taxon 810]|uniref:type II toxin-antitoxin system Phd/YefM family antitoxin n=1 Tax=Atopobium sp. oral taxon 810 TaxID=712158 RepID=UPI00039719BB|nr:type II toxin-antitoxin system Phd/YefM family antitoxin [Atopobium sp. oral taxon 810]ERI05392.1 prevent-host-death family protein [Atopobium sp. oral taxon 810 str. F0209]